MNLKHSSIQILGALQFTVIPINLQHWLQGKWISFIRTVGFFQKGYDNQVITNLNLIIRSLEESGV